jgi:broad specificity phosphatase PhoE
MQAEACGEEIRALIEKDGNSDWRVHFYVSPHQRALSTLKEIGRAFSKQHILGVREEPRIREQDFGNFQQQEQMKLVKGIRSRFGRFFYRFPEGESAADVFDRVTSFLESLWRDIDMNRLNRDVGNKSADLNLVIVSHGVTMRVFLMRWFKWTTEQFELLNNPHNCEVRVMQLAKGGEYSLLVHHTREELVQWGLSPAMIADQEWRKTAVRGQWNDQWPWTGTSFFDHFGEKKDEDSSEESSANHTPVNGNGPCHETTTAACENRRTPLDLIDTDFS